MERDIRIDMVESAEERYDAALDEALDAARGSYILFMEQDDWLAPGSLEAVSHEVRAHDLELAVLSLSMDTPSPRDGVHSHVMHLEPRHTEERDEFRDLVPGMLESGIMGSVRGKVFSADRIAELGLRFTLAQEETIFLIRYIEDVQRAGAVPAALYHAAVRLANAVPGSLDAYMLCEREYAAYCELAQKWSREHDEHFMRAIHTRHLHRLIACIKDAYGIAGLSGIERNERVRDILEAPSTRDTVDALGKKGLRRASRLWVHVCPYRAEERSGLLSRHVPRFVRQAPKAAVYASRLTRRAVSAPLRTPPAPLLDTTGARAPYHISE